MTKRVLILTEGLNPGGAETVTVNLANGLRQNGKVQPAVAAAPGPFSCKLNPAIQFYPLPRFSLANIPKLLSRISDILMNFKPDIIHCQGATHCLLAKLVCLLKNIRAEIILTYHSGKTRRMPNFLSGQVFNWMADKIIVIAEHRKRSLLTLGVKADKLHYLPNFVNTAIYRTRRTDFDKAAFKRGLNIPETANILLMAARLIPSKRADLFIDIVADVLKSDNTVYGIIAGDGPEFDNLRRKTHELGLENGIKFIGFQAMLTDYYLAADVFVFPSEHEVLPMVLIEACAAGLPAVCSNIAGNDEIVINGKTGFLISGPAAAYSASITQLLASPDMLAKFSNAAQENAARFDETACIAKMEHIYCNE